MRFLKAPLSSSWYALLLRFGIMKIGCIDYSRYSAKVKVLNKNRWDL